MKMYDLAFIIGSFCALYALVWDKAAIESFVSGITIGLYAGWRIWNDN